MIVCYFNVVGVSVNESEADAPLIVDGYGVLSLSVALESMQPIAWRHLEITETCCPVQILQAADRSSYNIGRQSFRFAAEENHTGFFVGKCFDHVYVL